MRSTLVKSAIISAACITACLITDCSSPFTRMRRMAERNNFVIFKIDPTQFPSRKDIQAELGDTLECPPFAADRLFHILGSLKYRREGLWGNTEGNVYYEEELKSMTPVLAEALKLLGKDRAVIVSRFDPDRGVLSRMQRVAAVLWVDKAGLNVLFGEIHEDLPGSEPDHVGDWQEATPVSFRAAFKDLSLLESPYYHLKTIKGYQHRTWAVFPEDQWEKAAFAGEKIQDTNGAGSAKPMVERLKALKDALDAGLLTQEEYQAKRKKVIEAE